MALMLQWKSLLPARGLVDFALRRCASLTIIGSLIGAPVIAQTLPQVGKVTAGSATIDRPNAKGLTVKQSSNRAVIDWNSFSIGSGNTVNFLLPSSTSATLNRVTGSMTSVIAGELHSNGELYLVNPNGIEITPTGVINTESFTASALAMTDVDFLSGKNLFTGSRNSASVANEGLISVAPRGSVLLIGGTVTNAGSIVAPEGKVGLAAGESVSVDLEGDQFLTVSVPAANVPLLRALITQSGRIQAARGQVSLRGATTADVARAAIEVSGEIDAASVSQRTDGVDFGRRTAPADGGAVSIDGGPGGSVEITGQISATSAQGTGGLISVTGRDVNLLGATLDASGATGGGAIRLGGDFHGQGTLPTAVSTVVGGGSMLRADATDRGNGGSVVVWSEGSTTDADRISARGGARGGDGGQVEVSSHDLLNFTGIVDLVAPHGQTGDLLLDPYNVRIQTASGAPADTCTAGTCTPSGSNSILTVAALQTALASSNVTVTTGAAGSDAGNITVSNPVTWSSGSGLTLSAANNINVNASVTATGSGAVTLNAAGGAISVTSATLSTNGGNLKVNAPASGSADAINLSGATLAVGTGTGTITGTSNSLYGVSFSGANSLTSSGVGSFSITGTSSTGTGLILNVGASVTNSGTLGLSGTSSNLVGLRFSSGTLTNSRGNATLNGTSGSDAGIYFSGTDRISNNGGGSVVLDASSASYRGWELNTGASFTTAGNVTVNATTSTGTGVYVDGSGSVSVSSGTLNLIGTASSSGRGANLLGSNTLSTSSSGALNISGSSSSGIGMKAVGNSSLTASGSVTFTGTSNSGNGLWIQGANSLTVSSGSLSVTGNSTSAVGVDISGANSASNSGGALTITGTSGSGNGIQVEASSSLTTTGNLNIAGTSSGGYGIKLYASDSVTASSGNLTLSGSSTSSFGQELMSASSITNNGTGTLTLSSVGGIDLNASITSTSGPTVITGSGNIAQSAGTLTVNNLLLSGASGNFALNASGNQIGILAADAAAVTVNDRSALTIGSVLGTAGVTTSAGVTLTTNGNLTIASGAPVSGPSPVLATSGAFINDAGSGAVTATSGHWLIYSSSPSSDTFGLLNSGNTALWNATDATLPPASVTGSGNFYLFALQPTLTFTSTNASKTYGVDNTSSIAGNYTTSGYQTGVANAFLGDTAASVYSGTPSVTSAGSISAATVTGGPYAITVAPGSMTSLEGYALSFQSTGLLTVNPATLIGVVTAANKVYDGTTTATLTGETLSGTIYNGDASNLNLMFATANFNSRNVLTADTVAATGLTLSGSAASNYDLISSTATTSARITPRPLIISADSESQIYGNPAPAFTYALGGQGLVSGDGLSGSLSAGTTLASHVGSHWINLGTLTASPNYTVTYFGNTLTIDPRSLTVTATPESQLFGYPTPLLTYTVGGLGLVNGDHLTGALSTPPYAKATVRSYPITQGTLAASSDYTLTYFASTLTVISAGWPTTAELAARTYASDLELSAVSADVDDTVGMVYLDKNATCTDGAALAVGTRVAPVLEPSATLSAQARCANEWARAGERIDWRALAAGRTAMTMPSTPAP